MDTKPDIETLRNLVNTLLHKAIAIPVSHMDREHSITLAQEIVRTVESVLAQQTKKKNQTLDG